MLRVDNKLVSGDHVHALNYHSDGAVGRNARTARRCYGLRKRGEKESADIVADAPGLRLRKRGGEEDADEHAGRGSDRRRRAVEVSNGCTSSYCTECGYTFARLLVMPECKR